MKRDALTRAGTRVSPNAFVFFFLPVFRCALIPALRPALESIVTDQARSNFEMN
jgi:hypothetical protein